MTSHSIKCLQREVKLSFKKWLLYFTYYLNGITTTLPNSYTLKLTVKFVKKQENYFLIFM